MHRCTENMSMLAAQGTRKCFLYALCNWRVRSPSVPCKIQLSELPPSNFRHSPGLLWTGSIGFVVLPVSTCLTSSATSVRISSLSLALQPLLSYLCLTACPTTCAWQLVRLGPGTEKAWGPRQTEALCVNSSVPQAMVATSQITSRYTAAPEAFGVFSSVLKWFALLKHGVWQGDVLPCYVLSYPILQAMRLPFFMTLGNTIPSFPLIEAPAVEALVRLPAVPRNALSHCTWE